MPHRALAVLAMTFAFVVAAVAPRWGDAACSKDKSCTIPDRLAQFGEASRARLAPHFKRAGVAYPPHTIALVAFKDRQTLQLYARAKTGDWRFVRAYPVLAASGELGPKLREGDLQVPEGRYGVQLLNPNSRFHVSLRLNYPNAFDQRMGRRDKRTRLGGDIMIHGKAVSIGCLAMGDAAAEELFTLAAQVGLRQVEVLVSPTDFRLNPEHAPPDDLPAWSSDLYRDISTALQSFPSPRD
jgi:hypothetical protein